MNQFLNMGNGTHYLKKYLHPNLKKAPFHPNKNSFKGDIYVLINNESYSSTTDFCAVASYNKRIKLIGQETSGAYCGNSSGNSFDLTLPNTRLVVDIPTWKYLNAVNCTSPSRGLLPDYEIIPNYLDYKNKIDQ